MKKQILLALIVGLLAGCATVPEAEIESARSYLYPKFKTVSEPQFAMSPAERAKGIREWYREAGTAWAAAILYELVVDRQGNVMKIRAVKPYFRDDADRYFTLNFQRILQGYKFPDDAMRGPYRTFYYMLLLKTETDMSNFPSSPP